MVSTAQKSDFLNDLFDAVIDLPDSIQITEDIFIIFKKYLKIRRKKNELKFIKQVGMHPTDRLVCKVKNIASGNDNVYKTGSFTSAQQVKTCNKRYKQRHVDSKLC